MTATLNGGSAVLFLKLAANTYRLTSLVEGEECATAGAPSGAFATLHLFE